jgi:carboxypeptidase D
LGFFKNFVDTFGLQNKKIYIAGESYAGYYIPYIADAMYNANDTEHFDIQGTLMYDPSTTTDAIQEQVPAVAYVDFWKPMFSLNDSFMTDLRLRADRCGYTHFLNEQLVFPPKGPLPPAPNWQARGCDLWNLIYNASILVNACFDVRIHLSAVCLNEC